MTQRSCFAWGGGEAKPILPLGIDQAAPATNGAATEGQQPLQAEKTNETIDSQLAVQASGIVEKVMQAVESLITAREAQMVAQIMLKLEEQKKDAPGSTQTDDKLYMQVQELEKRLTQGGAQQGGNGSAMTPQQATAKTSLTAPAHAGSKTLELLSTDGFQLDQEIVIDAGTLKEEVNQIVALGPLALKHALMFDHAASSAVTGLPKSSPAVQTEASHTGLEERVQKLESAVSELIESIHNPSEDLVSLTQRVQQMEDSQLSSDQKPASMGLCVTAHDEKTLKEMEESGDVEGLGAKEASRDLCYKLSYEFAASTWDMMVFNGLACVSVADSVIVCIATVGGALIQLIFIVVVGRSMVPEPLDAENIHQLELWRLFIGHKADYYDELTDSSLVARVCKNSMMLQQSASQTALFSSIDGFLGAAGSETDFITTVVDFDGRWLCCVCLFLWLLNCFNESISIVRYFRALMQRLSKTTSILEVEGDIVLHGLSHVRFMCMVVTVVIPRVIMLAMLTYYGSAFLINTTDLGDLLLNALALAFILEIDDVIFSAFAPMSSKFVQENLEPIHLKDLTRDNLMFRFIDLRSVMLMMMVVGATLYINYTTLADYKTSLTTAHTYLCSGDTDFVYQRNKATNIVYYAATKSQKTATSGRRLYEAKDASDDPGALKYIKETVIELTEHFGNGSKQAKNKSAVNTSIAYVTQLPIMTLEGSADLMTGCENVVAEEGEEEDYAGSPLYQPGLHVMKELYNGATSCSQIKDKCRIRDPDYRAARSICPESCGCGNSTGGLFDVSGCPAACTAVRAKDARQAATDNCTDPVFNTSSNAALWDYFTDYTSYLVSFNQLNETFDAMGLIVGDDTLADEAWTTGCDFIADLIAYATDSPNPCVETATLASVKGLCPTVCGVECPRQKPTAAEMEQQQMEMMQQGKGGPPADDMGGPPSEEDNSGGASGGTSGATSSDGGNATGSSSDSGSASGSASGSSSSAGGGGASGSASSAGGDGGSADATSSDGGSATASSGDSGSASSASSGGGDGQVGSGDGQVSR